jgi:uncharacterized protein (DUF1778 family)
MKNAKQTTRSRRGSVRLRMPISRRRKKLLQRAADFRGVSLEEFVISSVQEAALRAIEGIRSV